MSYCTKQPTSPPTSPPTNNPITPGMGYCSDDPAIECLTVDVCSCAASSAAISAATVNDYVLFERTRRLQVCVSFTKANYCTSAGCQWNGGSGCSVIPPPTPLPTQQPTNKVTSAPSNPPTKVPTNSPTQSVRFIIAYIGFSFMCFYVIELTPLFYLVNASLRLAYERPCAMQMLRIADYRAIKCSNSTAFKSSISNSVYFTDNPTN